MAALSRIKKQKSLRSSERREKGKIHMARKKKETRKFVPRNEFRYNKSPRADHHPQYIFGKKGEKLKGLPLTTSPSDKYKHIALTKNPNSKDKRISYLQLVKPHTAHERYFSEPLEGWRFAKEDMPLIRHRIKQYKKSMNRKPLMWYEKKKQKKK